MTRRRPLSDEDRDLWAGVARAIKPLPHAKKSPHPSPAPASGHGGEPVSPARPVTRHDAAVPQKKPPPLAPLDRRLKKRVARGREPIDARLDLHGFTQTQAHVALLRFLRRAQADGVKIALVVTGKGAGKGADRTDGVVERGVLKQQVPIWLSLPEFRPLVVGFEDAHLGHGGQGALYVRLRRAR
jgi:DNA-nicking Smr family endonuclease